MQFKDNIISNREDYEKAKEIFESIFLDTSKNYMLYTNEEPYISSTYFNDSIIKYEYKGKNIRLHIETKYGSRIKNFTNYCNNILYWSSLSKQQVEILIKLNSIVKELCLLFLEDTNNIDIFISYDSNYACVETVGYLIKIQDWDEIKKEIYSKYNKQLKLISHWNK